MKNQLGFLLDMDGVVYRGNQMVPGADLFVKRLKKHGIPVLFLTNNSQRARRDIAMKLQRMGIDVESENVFTCAMATARFLSQQRENATAFVIGENGLTSAMHHNGITVVDDDPQVGMPLRDSGEVRERRRAQDMLEEAIAAGGSTLRDFRDAHGMAGRFQLHAGVYGRAGESCARCGGTVRRIVQAQRSTFFCARRQRHACTHCREQAVDRRRQRIGARRRHRDRQLKHHQPQIAPAPLSPAACARARPRARWRRRYWSRQGCG